MKVISRRKFVAHSSGLLFSLQPFLKTFAADLSTHKKIVVLIHLAGGNDWFNTVIPYRCPDYYQSRPQLAIAPDRVLPLNNSLALHPAMSGIKRLYNQGKASFVLNVGHDQPTLSHHQANEILQTGRLARYAELAYQDKLNPLIFPAINIEPFSSSTNQMIVSSLSPDNGYTFDLDVHYCLRRGRLHRPAGACNRPLQKIITENSFARGLELIANMISNNYSATIYNISLGGFDTHENQLNQHASLLCMLSESIFSFQQNLEKHGFANQVLTVIQSEFGRSLKENDELGTDHGLTNHTLIMGNCVKGGIYGHSSYLTEGNAKHYRFDFHQILATFLERWLECPSKHILGTRWQAVDFI